MPARQQYIVNFNYLNRLGTKGSGVLCGNALFNPAPLMKLGMSGARLAITATDQLHGNGGRLALCTMCIDVGQVIAIVREKV